MFPNCSITSLKFASALLCLWTKKGRDGGSYEMISDSLSKQGSCCFGVLLLWCKMSSLQCRIVTIGCTEPSLAQTSPCSHCVLPSCANDLCSLFLDDCKLQRNSSALRVFVNWQTKVLWVMRKTGWRSKQDVFWHRDWTRCSEMFTHGKDCSQGRGNKESPEHSALLPHSWAVFEGLNYAYWPSDLELKVQMSDKSSQPNWANV